ncbi:autoinducer binding domain-containing protein [Sagittula salina]|uniref:Autoinducer binding domain-containing protein n=1 Tax=Sagittula salina TaxID=2820268 RepID=A0A940S2D5_9RHOB|nr:autoinducer binding domain-containing protein [Sagittula salina]MBP0483977.1 autoinducer binding domain-containing protein [Sagittula salina]
MVSPIVQDEMSSFGHVTFSTDGLTQGHAVSTFSAGWQDRYFAGKFYLADPVISFGLHGAAGSRITILPEKVRKTPLYEEARAFGAESNVAAVSHFGGSTRLFGGVNLDLDERVLPRLLGSVQMDHRRDLAQGLQRLSDIQIDLLDLAEEGHPEKVIAAELGVSLSTIAQRKRAICNAMGMTVWRSVLQLYTWNKWGGLVAEARSEHGQ